MIKAEIKPQGKNFRNNVSMKSTCNCGAQRVSTDLNNQIKI